MIIPAIDIKDRCVVRLVQGRRNEKVYSQDPLKTAKHWVKQGAGFLHIVDLDGAASGSPKNLEIVKEIAKNIEAKIEFGGGVRKIETIKELLGSGIDRVVLGTKAVEDEAFLKQAFKKFKNRIIVSIDAKEKNLAIKGWRQTHKGFSVLDFVSRLKEIGIREIIYTDTLKDGTLQGPNIKAIKALLKETGIKVIASGGISSLEDINKLRLLKKQGLRGVIIGKALYEGRFTLAQALRLA